MATSSTARVGRCLPKFDPVIRLYWRLVVILPEHRASCKPASIPFGGHSGAQSSPCLADLGQAAHQIVFRHVTLSRARARPALPLPTANAIDNSIDSRLIPTPQSENIALSNVYAISSALGSGAAEVKGATVPGARLSRVADLASYVEIGRRAASAA